MLLFVLKAFVDFQNMLLFSIDTLIVSRSFQCSYDNGRPHKNPHYKNLPFRLETEILDIETYEHRIIAPTLRNNFYREAGLFLVDIGFCKKTFSNLIFN